MQKVPPVTFAAAKVAWVMGRGIVDNFSILYCGKGPFFVKNYGKLCLNPLARKSFFVRKNFRFRRASPNCQRFPATVFPTKSAYFFSRYTCQPPALIGDEPLKHRSFYFADASATARLLGQVWEPDGLPRALVQIVHGVNEYGGRYAELAAFLTGHGFAVAAHDIMGHGGSVGEHEPYGYFAPKNGWLNCLADLRNFSSLLAREFPGLPLFLFGHSLGSFMTRDTLIRYNDGYRAPYAGVILSGTGCQSQARYALRQLVCGAACLFKGPRSKSRLARDMCFARYARPYRAEHPSIAWLTRDRAVYLAYAQDPYCRFMPGAEMIRQMMKGMAHMDYPRHYRRIDPALPFLLIAGDADPAGNFGKGPAKVRQRLVAAGVADVRLILYPGARHEVLSDPDKGLVHQDILTWLEEKLAVVLNSL